MVFHFNGFLGGTSFLTREIVQLHRVIKIVKFNDSKWRRGPSLICRALLNLHSERDVNARDILKTDVAN